MFLNKNNMFSQEFAQNEHIKDDFENLLETYGSPLYVYYEKPMRTNAQKFMNTFKQYIPNFQQYFAVKATPNIHILEILKSEGMGFDCSSITELELVDRLSTPSNIMYTSNYTSVEDFEALLRIKSNSESNIIINLDDTDGLENLSMASLNTNIELPDLISFRLNPSFGSTDSETTSNVLGGSNTKFGISSTKIVDAYFLAQQYGFTKFGVHVMTGSCILDVDYFKNLVDTVFEHINNINQKLGIKFEFVDLGGGIGIPYKSTQNEFNIESLASIIAEAVEGNKLKYNLQFDPIIVMENGRYITGPYGILLARCKSIKRGADDKKFYGLDASMANLMRPGMYGAYHEILVPRLDLDINVMETEIANVVGTLCENNDWFARDRVLPKGIKKNDIFAILDVGAHGFSMGFQYNGKLRSAEVLITNDQETAIEIRKRETHCFN